MSPWCSCWCLVHCDTAKAKASWQWLFRVAVPAFGHCCKIKGDTKQNSISGLINGNGIQKVHSQSQQCFSPVCQTQLLVLSFWQSLWHHDCSWHVWQKCVLHHKSTVLCSLLAKSEAAWFTCMPGELFQFFCVCASNLSSSVQHPEELKSEALPPVLPPQKYWQQQYKASKQNLHISCVFRPTCFFPWGCL